MFYNRWLSLWALWLIYNGAHCGMLQQTPSLPHVCVHSCPAVVMGGVMETVVLQQHRHATRTARSYWKERKNERVTVAAEHLISQPNCPEEGVFKSGPVRASRVPPRRPMRDCEMASRCVKQFSGRSFSCEKACFHMTCLRACFKLVKGREKKCFV